MTDEERGGARPVQNLASIVDRIRAIEARIQPPAPAAGFPEALALAADHPVASLAARSATTPARGAATAGITLAQMLGRPVASPDGTTGPLPATAGVAGSGLLRLPVDAPISSGFGPRVHPVTGQHRLHAGIDLAAPTGTPIGAAAAGTVSFAGDRGGYGNLVIVDHGDGTETRYAHQATIAVGVGQRVAAGDLLGTVGSTGLSTGPHLHFEFRRDGQPVDPAPLLGRG